MGNRIHDIIRRIVREDSVESNREAAELMEHWSMMGKTYSQCMDQVVEALGSEKAKEWDAIVARGERVRY